MDLDRLFESWRSARTASNHAEMDSCVRSARRLSASAGDSAWSWLDVSLQDDERKWFVAAMFDAQPVPKRLVNPMLHAGVLEKNPSFNRSFIEPCVKSFGTACVLSKLLDHFRSGTNEEKAGAASALYWVPGSNTDAELRLKVRGQLLLEFVNNEDLEVRRRIIPMLVLDESKHLAEFAFLVTKAVQIARSHSDEYIRHRVEIQLGAGGPFMAIPDARKA